jgi:glycosyltransferase involved in cell wall biosynthesis
VDSIVCCGEKSKAVHYEYGYALDKLTVIRNGYDTSFFNLNTQERNSFRDEMGVTDDLFLIGTVGRYAPQKDHANLLAALGQFKKTHNNFRLVLIGNGCEYSNAELMELVYNYDLAEYVYCLGSRADIVKVMNGLDLHVTSSAFGEAFPNVICEAMSCGTVCLTTDVGDASMIVGSRNLVVEASNDRELCQSLRNLYRIFSFEKETWNSMGVAARERIHKNYTIGIMVAQYNSVWNKD